MVPNYQRSREPDIAVRPGIPLQLLASSAAAKSDPKKLTDQLTAGCVFDFGNRIGGFIEGLISLELVS